MRNNDTRRFLGLATLVMVLGLSGAARADEVYFHFKGGSAPVVGEMVAKGLEGKLRALGASHEVEAPFDQASGQPTGLPMLRPFKLKRERGRASPRLLQAWAQGEVFNEVVVEYWVLLKTGVMNQYQTVTLKNARVVRIDHMAEQIPGQPAGQLQSTEVVHIVYTQMEYSDNATNTKAVVAPMGY